MKIQFGSRVHMLPLFFEISKKIAFTYPQSSCVCKVSWKTDIFYGLCKKEKNIFGFYANN
jgi:hypothetical protein